jgi:MFS family permease
LHPSPQAHARCLIASEAKQRAGALVFYGWRMVGVAFSAHMVWSGLGFYSLPRLLKPLAEQFADGERAAVAMLIPAMSLPGLIVGPLVGRAVARYPLGRVMAFGAVALALGFLAASRATELWHLIVAYAIALPIAASTLSAVGANVLVSNWFDRKRALALGISQVGISFSGVLVPFFVSWTLGLGGWSGTYLAFAAIAAASAPLLWFYVVGHPRERGLRPDGAPATAEPEPQPPAPLAFGTALRDPNLIFTGVAGGLCFSGTTAMVQNAHAFATDGGHSNAQADSLLAVIALGAAFGKLLFGALGSRFGERPAFIAAALSQGLAMAILPASREWLPALLTVGLLFGLALGGVMPAMSALLARAFGPAHFGAVMGYLSPVLIPFQMIGAPLAALAYDRLGSYDIAIYAFAAACGVAVLALLRVRLPQPASP